jgi:hypothetical protein
MLWEVFVSRFEEALEQYERHRLTAEEAVCGLLPLKDFEENE